MRAATLKVKVICARSLLAKDRNGTSDPYVVVRLGDQQQKTHVVNRNLNPVWNTEMLFTITASHVQESLRFSVWDKDFLRSDFLGQFSIDVASIVQFASDYDETKTSNLWYVLNPRKPDEPVRGEIGFRIGFVGDIGADLLAMFNQSARKSLDQATLVSSDDPADDFYFNNYVSGGVHADDPRAETPAGMAGAPDPRASDPSLDATPVDKSLIDHSEFYGLLTIEIVNARNLPFEASRARTFNCDPFVTVSFGKRTFRTKVVRNSLNPEWGQRIFLHIKTYEVTSNWSVVFSVHDYEDFASNECIGSAELKIQHIISAAAKAPAFGISCSEFPLSNMAAPLKTRRHSAHESGTVLNIKIGFLTYAKIRANYFHRQMQLFGDDATQSINKVSLVTMLDAIESTYSDETIDGIFADTGKTPDQALSFEECAKQLESRLHTRSPYADDSGYDLDIGGPQPVHFDKTPYGVRQGERMMDRRTCYICQKQLRSTVDLDVVSHVALCAFVSPANSDNFVLGGLIGPNNASRKWFTKILAYSTSNDPTSGRSSSLGTVRYQDRATGQLCEERIPTYIRLGVRLLYQSKGSQTPEEDAAIRTLLRDLATRQGRRFDAPSSASMISAFVAFHNIDLDEILEPMESFKTFNQFFCRKLKPSARIADSADPLVALSPADARTTVFKTVQAATQLWIKGSSFTIASLLGSDEEAKRFEHGSLAIFRLAPQDYHRFHFPVDGVVRETRSIDGTLFAVNPIAVRSVIDVYTENLRTVTTMDSTHFGRVAIVAIGAMLTGSIVLSTKPGTMVRRMDEHGFFKFGGSTIVVLFEAGVIDFSSDLLENSSQALETLVRVGSAIGGRRQV